MKSIYLAAIFFVGFFVNACAPTVTPTESPVPPIVPTQISTSLPVTPIESSMAPGNSTAAPLDDIIISHSVKFKTPDGATIAGELYGSGNTAVIFSVMGDCRPGWREFAQRTAAQGLMTLNYSWRDCGPAGPVSEEELVRNFVNDTRGAINFVRDQGARKIILAGASLGGIASAKLASESQASGLIIIASQVKIPNHDFKVDAADLNTNIPKLFLSAENDSVISADLSRELYEMAAEPKEWQIYPGSAHGTDLFNTEHGREVQDRILAFILSVSANP